MKKILLISFLLGLLNLSKAQDGKLDPSFGNGGVTVTDIGISDTSINNDTNGKQVLLNPDGSMYFISGNLYVDYLYISKKDKDGNPDLSFGKNGYAATLPLITNGVQAALQKDGKIVIAGHSRSVEFYGKYYSVVYRLNTDGSLDNTFNGKGLKISTLISNIPESPLAIQKDGKIVVGGSVIVNNSNRYLLYRLNTDGSEDKPFTKIGTLTDSVISYKSITIQENGKIVAAGYKAGLSYKNIFTLSRYNTDGSIDTNFNPSAIPDSYTSVHNLPPGAFTTLSNIISLINEDGNILVAGSIKNNFGIARFKKDGSFDTLVITNFSGSFSSLLSAAIGSDGTIILTGAAESNAAVITSFNKNLSVNLNFSDDGKLLAGADNFLNGANALAIQKDGKIVLIGYIIRGDYQYPNIAAARFNSNGSIDESFGDKGKLFDIIRVKYSGFNATAVQTDGKIVMGGYALNGKDLDFALARYTTDGNLDTSFSADGKVMTDGSVRTSPNYIQAMAIQTDGKIIAGGYGEKSTSLVRYNINGMVEHNYGSVGNFSSIVIQKDGSFILSSGDGLSAYRNLGVDISFNNKGSLKFPSVNNLTVSGKQIALQKDEKIIVLGGSTTNPSFPIIFRYNLNGKLDSNFGINGIVLNYLKGSGETANTVCVQTDDKIIIGGTFQDVSNPAIRTFSISRLNKNGSRDSTFNKGEILHPFSEGADIGNTIKLQSDGKIIIAGNTIEDGQTLFKIARFNSDGSIDKTFNNKGSVTTYPGGSYANITNIAIQGNNLYAAGYALFPGSAGIIAKYRLCNAPEALQLKLIQFKGRLQNNATYLNWEIENQQKLSYFTVERSRDSLHFYPMENINAHNNTYLKKAYSTVDNRPLNGANYYRLKLKNTDSSFIYSQLVIVNLINTKLSFKISPNPAKSKLMVNMNGENEKAIIQIFDISGKKYKELSVFINGNTTINLDINALPNGMYNLQLIKKSITEKINFLKQ